MADSGNIDLPNFTKMVKEATASVKELRLTLGQITASTTGGGGMAGSLGKISAGMGAIGSGVKLGNSMMPQLQDIVSRSTAFYNANVMQGNRFTQGQMYNSLRNSLGRFGIQDAMSTAQLAQTYGNRGVVMGSAFEQNLTSAVGGAVKYLNMDTRAAAGALEGFSNGRGSANLLRNFGIYTANPFTGKVSSQQQIFEQIHSRISNGRQATVEQTQESYRRGALGYFLNNSGMSQDQQQMYYMWELSKAGGVKMDLADPKSMSAAMKQLKIKNPQLALNEIAASQEGVLESGTSSYLSGLNNSVGPIQALNVAAGELAATFGSFKALLDSINSTRSGGAGLGAAADIVSGVGSSLVANMLTKGKGGPRAGGGQPVSPTGSAYFAKGKNPVKPTMGGVKGIPGGLKVAGAAGAVLTAASTVSNISQGAPLGRSIGEGIGSIAGMILGGMVGSATATPGVGTVVGGMAGSALGAQLGGAIGGLFDGSGGSGKGGKSSDPTSMNPDTRENRANNIAKGWHRPARGTITSGYGPRKAEFPGMSTNHQGVDVGASGGKDILAARSGKVIYVQRNASGFGNYVRIYHKDVNKTSGYAHMASFSVQKGQTVKGGQKIGVMGMSGSANGIHLHFNLTRGKGGTNYMNPEHIAGLGLNGGGSNKPTGSGGAGSGGKPAVAAAGATSSSSWGIPSSGSSGGMSTVGAGSVGDYGVGAMDYLSISGGGGSIFGSSSSSILYTPGATKAAGSETSSAVGGESTVTPISSMGESTTVEYNSASSMASSSKSGGSAGSPNVTINLTVARATDSEARRFAEKVKSILENDSNISTIGKK